MTHVIWPALNASNGRAMFEWPTRDLLQGTSAVVHLPTYSADPMASAGPQRGQGGSPNFHAGVAPLLAKRKFVGLLT